MGHVAGKLEVLGLQRRLDKMVIGAPAHRALLDIIAELFTAEECRLAAAMPLKLASARRIARCAGMSESQAVQILRALVGKGLVVDFERDDGRTYYFLNPAMIGFFEFTMMRVREEVDQKKVARLMWEYLAQDPDRAFLKMIAEGETFIARPLVHEDALAPEVFSEVLDYEKATHLIEQAGSWAEGICHCRHIKMHIGERCDYPLEQCLSIGFGADYLTRAGIAQRITKERALEVLARAREQGLVQMGDNVQQRPTFICNCCKCCCEMLYGLRTLPRPGRLVTSSYVARIDLQVCTGCGTCRKACPIDVIDLVDATPTDKAPRRRKRATVNEDLCLGCGVCHRGCKHGALQIVFSGHRVHTPDSTIEKLVRQAVERGKLGNLLFDDHTRVTHRALSAMLNALLGLPPAKQALAQKQLRSGFVSALIGGVKRTGSGRVAGRV